MITRFAPSPTGPLHLGHAYSAMLAHNRAQASGGVFLLRIEDIDQSRARPEWEEQIFDDLRWLGLRWPAPVMYQSHRMAAYRNVLDALSERGLTYACTCSRRDIADALSAPQEGVEPPLGPDGPVYPGTCRPQGISDSPEISTGNSAVRLNMTRIAPLLERTGPLFFTETGAGPEGETGRIEFTARDLIETVGDIVLARRDMGTSYHLSVVIDDAAQGVTDVVRGQDLFGATKIHVALQRLIGLPSPVYYHHRLIRDDSGARLAKRDDARAIATYRADGATPADIRAMIGL